MRLGDPSERLRTVRGSRSSSRIVGALEDPSPEVARAAIMRLVELDGPRAAGVLRERLLIADLQVVGDVAAALRALGDTAAVGVAVGGLSDESYTRRLAGSRALGVLGDPRARDPLRRALRDEIAGVRMAAFEALGTLEPDEGTAPACLLLLTDPNSQVRVAAVRTVARLAPTRLTAASALAEDRDCLVRGGGPPRRVDRRPVGAAPVRRQRCRGPRGGGARGPARSTPTCWRACWPPIPITTCAGPRR